MAKPRRDSFAHDTETDLRLVARAVASASSTVQTVTSSAIS
jgi:hypothetical protein